MEARKEKSEKKHKKKSHSHHEPIPPYIVASKQIEEFVCPITTDVFFEPVMFSNCGHCIEEKFSTGLQQCPVCREPGPIIPAPSIITNLLANTLAADPTLWQKVYLNYDYLDYILRTNKLKTPSGERFIKLLENNTAKNLEEQPLIDSVGTKGQSIIELLLKYEVGFELLSNNPKIRALVSADVEKLLLFSELRQQPLVPPALEPSAVSPDTAMSCLQKLIALVDDLEVQAPPHPLRALPPLESESEQEPEFEDLRRLASEVEVPSPVLSPVLLFFRPPSPPSSPLLLRPSPLRPIFPKFSPRHSG